LKHAVPLTNSKTDVNNAVLTTTGDYGNIFCEYEYTTNFASLFLYVSAELLFVARMLTSASQYIPL
jgi:hypothetical protein